MLSVQSKYMLHSIVMRLPISQSGPVQPVGHTHMVGAMHVWFASHSSQIAVECYVRQVFIKLSYHCTFACI